jgi:hypothetical protein
MKVRFMQANGFGCGMYALANVMDDESIITSERLELSKNGNYFSQLSTWLRESGYPDFEIEPLYCNLVVGYNPPKDWHVKPLTENLIFPFLLQVQFKELGKAHMVACMAYHDQTVSVIDSLKSDVVKTTWKAIMNLEIYPIVTGVFGICDKREKDKWFMLIPDSSSPSATPLPQS